LQTPLTQYARRPDGVHIAYQVFGEGPRDLVFVPGFVSHVGLMWTEPGFVRFMERLGSFARVIFFDKPGTGLSDPLPRVPTVEDRAGDIECLLDTTESEQAIVMGFSEGSASAAYFAATAPERVEGLILYGAAHRIAVPDEDEAATWGITAEQYPSRRLGWQDTLETAMTLHETWGQGNSLKIMAPSLYHSAVQRRMCGVFERSSASPGMIRAVIEAAMSTDISDVAANIQVPTVVLNRVGDVIPMEAGRHLAALIPGARFVALPGTDHAFWLGDSDEALDVIEEFVTGSRPTATPAHRRTLTTVLFSDIVGSTEQASALGDAAWTDLLARHDSLARDQVSRNGGRIVKTTGDGFLAVFDGPARAIRAADDFRAAVSALDLQVRMGVHTGECDVTADGDVAGIAIHIGARVAASAATGEVLVSGTVKDLVVGSRIDFSDRGLHELKGVPGRWHLYALGEDRRAVEPLDGPEQGMRVLDRATVAFARRAPQALRLANRIMRPSPAATARSGEIGLRPRG
jgi:class 3 adenylate cyclase